MDFPKHSLQEHGFDKFGREKTYKHFLGEVEPKDKCTFNEAYAYGGGIMLNFNEKYIGAMKQSAEELG